MNTTTTTAANIKAMIKNFGRYTIIDTIGKDSRNLVKVAIEAGEGCYIATVSVNFGTVYTYATRGKSCSSACLAKIAADMVQDITAPGACMYDCDNVDGKWVMNDNIVKVPGRSFYSATDAKGKECTMWFKSTAFNAADCKAPAC